MTQITVNTISNARYVQAGWAPASGHGPVRSVDAEADRNRSLPRPTRPKRPARGAGRATVPVLRPTPQGLPRAALRRPMARPHACELPSPEIVLAPAARQESFGWRLTDRGVALVLVVGLMIMVAAMTVVGLTALRVTGGGYQTSVSAGLPR